MSQLEMAAPFSWDEVPTPADEIRAFAPTSHQLVNQTYEQLMDDIHGQVKLVDGQVVITPDADYHGTASFTYTLDGYVRVLVIKSEDLSNIALGMDAANDAEFCIFA